MNPSQGVMFCVRETVVHCVPITPACEFRLDPVFKRQSMCLYNGGFVTENESMSTELYANTLLEH